MSFEPHLEHFHQNFYPPPSELRATGPWRVDSEFLDESFSSTINFIPLVETVPKLAVEEASFIFVASRCGPPLQGGDFERVERRARPPTRA